jgi:integrase
MQNVNSTTKMVKNFIRQKKDYQHCSKHTVKYYESKLKLLTDYFITYEEGYVLTQSDLQYFFWNIESRDYEPSTVKAIYTAIRVFFNWWEYIDEDFVNPMTKIRPPRIKSKILDPIKADDIKKLLACCDLRDASILMTLGDSGARSTEILMADRENFDYITGEIYLKTTKSGRPRRVFVGPATRKVLKKYLKTRKDNNPALFVGWRGRLSYNGLNAMLKRRALEAGINPPPTLHSFRRFYTLEAARANMSLPVLAAVLGHSGYGTLHRYLKLTGEDVQTAQERVSPMDNL